LLIPRVIHQIWFGPEPLPEQHARYQETWLGHHPGWELRLWTEDNIPRDLRRPEALERLRRPVERSDILRFELVWRFGGIYIDTDMECLRSIEARIAEARFFCSYSGQGRPHPALFGAVAGHPILDSAIDGLLPSEFYGGELARVASFAQIVNAHGEEVVLLHPAIHRANHTNRELAYAVHHRDAIWKADPVFVRRLHEVKEKARSWRARYEEAAEQSNHWRARCEELETELDSLRSYVKSPT
jgi:hypothetical protein